MMRDFFHSDQVPRATTQKSLSNGVSLGLGGRRLRKINCSRRARFLRRRSIREEKFRLMMPARIQKPKSCRFTYSSSTLQPIDFMGR
jgi:hypothetical protein